MAERVRLTDVAPRDGLQNEAGVIETDRKLRLIELIAETGVDEIEATSFVSPKWVPQLADASELMEALRNRLQAWKDQSEPSPPGRGQGEGNESDRWRARPHDSRSPSATERARELRRRETHPERRLWSALRSRRFLDLKFHRQQPIGPFVVDFFCEALRLVIELDGRSHEGEAAPASDQHRQAWLESQGLRVVRFTNDDVMQNLDAVLRSLQRVVDESSIDSEGRPLTPALSRGERGLEISVLVPNDKGFERAARFHTPEFPLKIAVFTAASETFSQRNTNATIDETIERFRAFVPRALDMGMAVRMYISCAIKCPFEGDVASEQVRSVCDRLLDLAGDDAVRTGKAELDLGDTIGAGTSDSVAALIDQFDRHERTRLVLHLHDTFGRAPECVRTGLEMGVRSFDGSAAGLGGCPYAGTKEKPAPGNIAMSTLVRTIEDAGYKTSINHEALEKASAFARRIVDEARAEEAGAGS